MCTSAKHHLSTNFRVFLTPKRRFFMVKEKKHFSLFVSPEARQMVADYYQKDNCDSQSEFVEKAIRFYIGYLNAQHAESYLPRILADVLEGKLTVLGDRIGALLFKLSVEQAIADNILSYYTDMNMGTLKELRAKCAQDVMRTNGKISFEDALKFQKDL